MKKMTGVHHPTVPPLKSSWRGGRRRAHQQQRHRQCLAVALVLVVHFLSSNDEDGSITKVHGLQSLGRNIASTLSSKNSDNKNKKNIVVVGRVDAGPIQISEMGCGTWSWGNQLLWNYNPKQDDEIYSAYKIVRDAGVTLFDTADSYGTGFDLNGRSEVLLGQFERRYQQEEENGGGGQMDRSGTNNDGDGKSPPSSFLQNLFKSSSSSSSSTTVGGGRRRATTTNRQQQQQVATKFAAYPWRLTRRSIVNAAESSLKRLQQSKLTLAQVHWSTSNYFPYQENVLWDGIADVYDAKLCDAVGVSNYGPEQLRKFARKMEGRDVPLATAQSQFSLMTYKDPISRDMVEACEDVNCRLIAYSPLCLGLLTGKYSVEDNILPPPGNPRRQLFRELLPGAKPLLNLLDVIGRDLGDKTSSQVAIRWSLQKGGVPIPGVRTVQQARDNIGVMDLTLSTGMMEELDRCALAIDKPMIQNIFQTR